MTFEGDGNLCLIEIFEKWWKIISFLVRVAGLGDWEKAYSLFEDSHLYRISYRNGLQPHGQVETIAWLTFLVRFKFAQLSH
jgi:hypothetical protein